MRVILIELVGEKSVFMANDAHEAHFICSEEDNSRCCSTANNIASALGLDGAEQAKVPESLTEPDDWTYEDVAAHLSSELAEGKLKTEPLMEGRPVEEKES